MNKINKQVIKTIKHELNVYHYLDAEGLFHYLVFPESIGLSISKENVP